MRFASLGSGSEGNGLVVEARDTRVLIDCGFGVRDTVARLARLGIEPESVSAILVTHEHSDHVGGVPAFAARYRIPVWLTFGTLQVVGERFVRAERVYGFDSHDAFGIGELEIRPFPVPHDAREPVQFVVGDGGHTPNHAASILPDSLRWLWRDWKTQPNSSSNAATTELPRKICIRNQST